MSSHTLETNFAFLKSLAISKELGNTKFQFRDMLTPKEIEFSYRMLCYKKHADEFKIGFVKSKIKLTQYQKGKPLETIKIKIK